MYNLLYKSVKFIYDLSPNIKKPLYNYIYPKPKRKTISKKTRLLVWQKVNTNLIGVCYCCGDSLQMKNMHVAHIIPHIKEGTTNMNNLVPTCMHCNLQMKTSNLYDYIKKNNLKGPGSKINLQF